MFDYGLPATGRNVLAAQLRPVVFACVAGFVGYAAWSFTYQSPELLLGGIAVSVAALVPILLWAICEMPGLPIFPAYAAYFLQFSALPLLISHPAVARFSPEVQLQSALTVAGYLMLATVAWYWVVRRMAPASSVWVFAGEHVWSPLTIVLAFVLVFNVLLTADLLPNLGSWYSFIRNSLNGAAQVSLFVLWYAIGGRSLGKVRRVTVVVLTLAFLVWQATGLILAAAFGTVCVCAIAFTVSRRRIPVLAIAMAGIVLAVLHPGKFAMRERYAGQTIGPLEYPMFFEEWIGHSIAQLDEQGQSGSERQKVDSASDRAAIIHMMMTVQDKTPDELPYLAGETYTPIPSLLLPRVLNADKPSAHVGTHALSISYGLQTREQTEVTTIGWSLESEAFANFGFLGVAGLAVLIGSWLGWHTARSGQGDQLTVVKCAALSAVTVLICSASSAGLFVSTLVQTQVALFALSALICRPAPVHQ